MIRLREKIQVKRPIETVFRYAGDFKNIQEWDPGVKESRKRTLGATGVGTVYDLRLQYGLVRLGMEYRVTKFDPPHEIVLEGGGKSFQVRDCMRFQEAGGGTEIVYQADFTFSGIRAKLENRMRPWLIRLGRNALQGLSDAFSGAGPVPGIRPLDRVADRLIVPGMIGFSKIGYRLSRNRFRPNPENLIGKTVVLTGATSGIGKATAFQLAEKGARLAVIARNVEKAGQLRKEIAEDTGHTDVEIYLADMGIMEDVRRVAERIQEQESRIDVLINNAGALFNTRQETREGNELTLATDLLGPFLLTERLIPKITENPGARIINVSSGGMYTQKIEVDDLQFQAGPYEGAKAYARAKRGMVILTEGWAEQLKDKRVVVHAMHPGWVETQGVIHALPAFYRLTRPILRNADQGADTIAWLATSREAGTITGKFWLDRRPHITHVFPGTRETQQERARLQQALRALTGGGV